jgi:2-iminobutanoate/2-iminopropanoate deaminase
MKKIIHTNSAPLPIGPYSQAVIAGNLLFVSGQIALDAETGELEITDIPSETRKVMKNIEAILTSAGCSFENVVKTSIFLSNMIHFQSVNEVYASYFSENYPARETVAVAGLPKGVNVEISVIVSLP